MAFLDLVFFDHDNDHETFGRYGNRCAYVIHTALATPMYWLNVDDVPMQ